MSDYSNTVVVIVLRKRKFVCNVQNKTINFVNSCRFCEDHSDLSRHMPGLITPVRVSAKHGFEPVSDKHEFEPTENRS